MEPTTHHPGRDADDRTDLIELRPAREHLNMRLDRFVTDLIPEFSRSYIQQLIDDGHVEVDGQARRAAFKMTPGQFVTISVPAIEEFELEAQDIPLDIIHEDAHVLVVNKPAGLVVHPAAGHQSGTLVNAVLFHCPEISIQGSTRPGIVHRLDKDTSGVMVIAKSDLAQTSLVEQWLGREVHKHYTAIVAGLVEEETATINVPIGRNPVNRQQMSTGRNGREAITHFTVAERLAGATLLDLAIETGRTHQIRVHLNFIGFPVVGDRIYGNKLSARLAAEAGVNRLMLHARALTFRMPDSGEQRTFEAPTPDDMAGAIAALRSPANPDAEA